MSQKGLKLTDTIKNLFKSDGKKSLKEAEFELAKLKLLLKEAEYDVIEAELQIRNTKIELNQIILNNN